MSKYLIKREDIEELGLIIPNDKDEKQFLDEVNDELIYHIGNVLVEFMKFEDGLDKFEYEKEEYEKKMDYRDIVLKVKREFLAELEQTIEGIIREGRGHSLESGRIQ